MAKNLLGMLLIVTLALWLSFLSGCQMGGLGKTQVRRIAVEDYTDKMQAGWIGQMAGVGWGGPTEFHYKGEIIAVDKMPSWEAGND